MIDRLEKHGLVRRVPHPVDRRAKVQLTPKGCALRDRSSSTPTLAVGTTAGPTDSCEARRRPVREARNLRSCFCAGGGLPARSPGAGHVRRPLSRVPWCKPGARGRAAGQGTGVPRQGEVADFLMPERLGSVYRLADVVAGPKPPEVRTADAEYADHLRGARMSRVAGDRGTQHAHVLRREPLPVRAAQSGFGDPGTRRRADCALLWACWLDHRAVPRPEGSRRARRGADRAQTQVSPVGAGCCATQAYPLRVQALSR